MVYCVNTKKSSPSIFRGSGLFRWKPVPVIIFPATCQFMHSLSSLQFYIMIFGLKESTQPRCGSDLTHAVSLIAAPPLNTNVHLLMAAQAK